MNKPSLGLWPQLYLCASLVSAAAWSQPLSLSQATRMALEQSHEVAAAAAALETDLAAARVASDAFRPEAAVSTTPGVGRGLPLAVGGQAPSLISVGVRQSLFNREARSQAFAARATSSGTRGAYARARLQVARTVVDLYARCWVGERLLAEAELRLGAYASMATRAAALHEQGRVTEVDLAQARLREARARLRRMEIAAARDTDLWELRQRLGLAADAPLELPLDPLSGAPDPRRAPTVDDLTQARATDPDLAATNRQVDLLSRSRDERQGILAPVTIEADAQYSRLSRANGVDQFYVKFREDDWSVALAVAVPLWTGGRLRDNLGRADANLERVKQERHARTAALEIEVHRAQAALAGAEAARAVGAQASAVAVEELRISQALAAEGRAQPDDLDGRTAAVADAAEEEVKATAAILNARVQLSAVRGDLFAQLGIVNSPGGAPPAARPMAASPDGIALSPPVPNTPPVAAKSSHER